MLGKESDFLALDGFEDGFHVFFYFKIHVGDGLVIQANATSKNYLVRLGPRRLDGEDRCFGCGRCG